MKINFVLTPLQSVTPWGNPPKQSLHWFGLTDGQYWIEVGDQTLFEYTMEARAELGCKRYCDYQVVRLYEDLFDMVPWVLEPVPDEVVPYLVGPRAVGWTKTLSSWLAREDGEFNDEYWATAELACHWLGMRTLDSGYLSAPTEIRMWSDETHVHVAWNNHARAKSGMPVWTATAGGLKVTRDQYLSEMRSFHERLIGEMGLRCNEIAAGHLSSAIQIDRAGLVREQLDRARTLDSVLHAPQAPTDWSAVLVAIQKVEAESGRAEG